MNRIINNNKYKKIDWRTVGRILVAIIIAMILTLLIDKFIPNIFTKNTIKIISITVIILNIFSYYKIRTMENTRFSRALKQFKLWDRIIRTFESSAMLSLYSILFLYEFCRNKYFKSMVNCLSSLFGMVFS